MTCGVQHLLILLMGSNIISCLLIIILDLAGFICFKSNAFAKFVHFNAMIENQFSSKIKIFRSDRGGEFTSNDFKTYLSQHGITHHLSCPHTPQQNGVVERKHRHLIETIVTLFTSFYALFLLDICSSNNY